MLTIGASSNANPENFLAQCWQSVESHGSVLPKIKFVTDNNRKRKRDTLLSDCDMSDVTVKTLKRSSLG
jgi:hypothetical protein